MRRTARAALTHAEAKKPTRARLTADGWKLLHALAKGAHADGKTIDARAAVGLLRSLGPLTEGSRTRAPESEAAGMTILEAALHLGVDRRRLPKALVEIPPGPVPPLPPGRVPARRIGSTLRIFPHDLLGLARPAEETRHAREAHREAPPDSADRRTTWDGPLRDLLHRRA